MSSTINYLEVAGNALEQGQAHGEAFRNLIHDAIEEWDTFIHDNTSWTFEHFLDNFILSTDYQSSVGYYTPQLMEEIRGISEGADLPFRLIYAWQLVDEWLNFIVEDVYAEKCSSLGAYKQTKRDAPLIGKTQDLPHLFLDKHVVLKTRNDRSNVTILMSSMAGVIASDGVNDDGLGVVTTHLGQLRQDPAGLPVAFVIKSMLENCTNVKEAKNYLNAVPHATGMSYTVADVKDVKCFEVSAHAMHEHAPAPKLHRVWHTNHPVGNQDYGADFDATYPHAPGDFSNTQARYKVLTREVSKQKQPVTAERAKQILSTREGPISVLPEDGHPTVSSTIIECSKKPVMHFAPGPPHKTDYIPFTCY